MTIDKRNIFLTNTLEHLPYTSVGMRGPVKRIPERDVNVHGNFIKRRLEEAYSQSLTQKQAAATLFMDGIYLEFSSAGQQELTIKSLENLKTGIRLLNVRTDKENDIIKATVYIPAGKESYFIKKANDYLTSYQEKGKASNNDLISSIEDVKLAFLDAFWTGSNNTIPQDQSAWCEIWLRVEDENYFEIESSFEACCDELQVHYEAGSIRFPERMVKLVRADAIQLTDIISRSAYIAEMRRAPELAGFFDELSVVEQREWVDDLLMRIDLDFSNTTICLLDTGLNAGHPLLEKATDEKVLQSVDPAWGFDDHKNHGTEMAGIALYENLQEKLFSSDRISLRHRLESVKILPRTGSNDPMLYGEITQRAVYLAEIANPHVNRVFCMAVTSDVYNTGDGSPTSWSGEIDNITAGVPDDTKRLFIISAGNVHTADIGNPENYPSVNIVKPVASPGQAWNAITIGAYSNAVIIEDHRLDGYTPVAAAGGLSPYSSTSASWNPKWPIKPEILCDGGNIATDGTFITECSDLSLLTTHFQPMTRLLTTTRATSAAAAQASYIAAQLIAEYPGAWPETIRALMIHSASWTQTMLEEFCKPNNKTVGRKNLLRTCGYGRPNLEKAIQCMNNSVNLVIESELTPYTKDRMNEMHLHNIPWPKEVLKSLGATQAELRVTLSYFIEPGPGEIGWKNKYRYPSCGLRFDLINNNERKEDFVKRINTKMREDSQDRGEGTSGSKDWYLGSDNRDVGSIHSDFKRLSAVDLCEAEYVAIYPVIGWWRERAHLHRYNDKIRYSLIVTISTPGVETDLYTPIITQIKVPIATKVEVNF